MQPAPPVPPAPGAPVPPDEPLESGAASQVGERSGRVRAARADRWEWRRRVRAHPRKRRVYRVVVGCVGALLILLGIVTGPLPGPGGIPLVLAGLAVLASEFVWAHRLLRRARVALHRSTRWAGRQPRWVRLTGSLVTAACVVGGAWLWLVVLGPPAVLPAGAQAFLDSIPGVDP